MLIDTIKRHTRLKRSIHQIQLSALSKTERENLQREIRIHASLNHPYIIRFIGSFEEEGHLYIVMDKAANGSLFLYIDANNGLGEDMSLRFLAQTAQALHYLHSQNVLHRDIKPENVLFDAGFNIKLCDFGGACLLDPVTRKTSICGTYEYMPPEMVNNPNQAGHTAKLDCWCLGVLLYEMLHGLLIRKTPL